MEFYELDDQRWNWDDWMNLLVWLQQPSHEFSSSKWEHSEIGRKTSYHQPFLAVKLCSTSPLVWRDNRLFHKWYAFWFEYSINCIPVAFYFHTILGYWVVHGRIYEISLSNNIRKVSKVVSFGFTTCAHCILNWLVPFPICLPDLHNCA